MPPHSKRANIDDIDDIEDGGGVRGLSSLIILQEFMRRVQNAKAGTNIHPHEHFDVIAGAGTGGQDKRLHAGKAANARRESNQGATKLQEALKAMTQEATGREGEMMNEGQGAKALACKTVVFTMARHNLNANLPVIFRSYTVTSNPVPDCPIWEALYATMAHPELFKSIDILDSEVGLPQSFVGGELGCSNPLAHLLSEVNRVYPDRRVACIVSIGAGHARTIQVPTPSRWHRTRDVIVMKDMATDSERVAEELLLRFQATTGVYFRFNVDQGMQDMTGGSWERLGEVTQHTRAYLQKAETNQRLEEAMRVSIERRGAVSTTQAAGHISDALGAARRPTGYKRCPAPTAFYTGREDEKKQVISNITGGRDERRVCVVHGLGGVGKTQLALSAIECTWDEWDHIIYVDASSSESLEKALKESAEARNIGQSYKELINWLESCGERWLVVFDNADTASVNIRQYIPARGRGGSVLITTRLPDLARLAYGRGSMCHLSSMSQTDGASLLVKIASSANQCLPEEDLTAAEKLVKDFGCLALAIVHAGAFIAHSPGMNIVKYRSLFSSQRQRMLEEYSQLPQLAKLDERSDTVYTTWKLCYDQLKPESRELLWLLAYLHYDGISEDIFRRAAQNMRSKAYPLPFASLESQAQEHVRQYLSSFLDSDGNWDTVKFAGVMGDLASYSLVEFDRMNLTYRLHVLVHDWAKTVVPHNSELAIDYAATVLSLSIDQEEDAESLGFKRQLGLHATSVLIHNPDVRANHYKYFTEVYSCTGQWTQKAELENKLIEVFRRELGSDSIQTWSLMHRLALSRIELGQWVEGLHLQTQVYDAYKRILGDEHLCTLTSINDLALTYSRLGRHNEAEQLQLHVLDTYQHMLGREHPNTLTSMDNLALTYSHLGRYNEAEQLLAQVLSARKHVLGKEHPNTLTSMNNIATTYSFLGRHNEAEQLKLRVLDAYKRIFGEEHPRTFTPMNNLALTYSDLGQHSKAEQLQVQALKLCKHILGEEHPHTLCTTNDLASTYSHLGRYHEAEKLQIQVLNARKHTLGEEHPYTLNSINELASTYSHLGRHSEAGQLQAQVLSGRKRILGGEHPDTLTSTNDLAMTYLHLGRHEAERLQLQVIDAYKHILGEEHPYTLVSISNLALIYSHLNRHNEAEQLLVQVFNARKRVLGGEHPHTLLSMNGLAWTYFRLDRWDEAGELYHKVISIAERTLGHEHPTTQLYHRNLRLLETRHYTESVRIF